MTVGCKQFIGAGTFTVMIIRGCEGIQDEMVRIILDLSGRAEVQIGIFDVNKNICETGLALVAMGAIRRDHDDVAFPIGKDHVIEDHLSFSAGVVNQFPCIMHMARDVSGE